MGRGQVEKVNLLGYFWKIDLEKSTFSTLLASTFVFLKAFFGLKCTSKSKIEQTKCFTAKFYPRVQSLVLLSRYKNCMRFKGVSIARAQQRVLMLPLTFYTHVQKVKNCDFSFFLFKSIAI